MSSTMSSQRRRKHVPIAYEERPLKRGTQAANTNTNTEKMEDNGILPSSNLEGLNTDDNAAVALVTIKAGETLVVAGEAIGMCKFDIPEGHRFTTKSVAEGEPLLSWGLPFGIALRALDQGEYLCNVKVLATFKSRRSPLNLPSEPSFENATFKSFSMQDEAKFIATKKKIDTTDEVKFVESTFNGIPRPGGRGTGTRNYVVVIGISASVAGFVRAIEKEFKKTRFHPNVDGVVAVAHTEGGNVGNTRKDPGANGVPTNRDKVLRVLAGFSVHPNVAGVLMVDRSSDKLQAQQILDFMNKNGYPIDHVPFHMLTLTEQYTANLEKAKSLVQRLLDKAHLDAERVKVPVSQLFLAQQCGGSDAFSGISANPMAGWVARQIVGQGGGVLLAETDELMGAESYILNKIGNYKTGVKFLNLVDRFYAYARQFGHSPEGNPSGGNLFRGLYNITLKSCGAAMKKFPDVRLEEVLEYAERYMPPGKERGYCFMDSPGNDLESIAGQVACGCNIVMFTTGNGAITNFPFVPTVKVLTTTARYQLLSKDMDINAGVYLDGTPMRELGSSAISYLVNAASGKRTKGELAGHHQVQIWREWRALSEQEQAIAAQKTNVQSTAELTGGLASTESELVPTTGDGVRNGQAININAGKVDLSKYIGVLSKLQLLQVGTDTSDPQLVTDRIGLIVPTSLCSSHVSKMLAEKLEIVNYPGVSRVVALPHTEGCGHSAGDSEEMFIRTILGYAIHPMVACATLVEHGCEKTHNDRLAATLKIMGRDPTVFGYASIQLDGGIDGANDKIVAHFNKSCPQPCTRIQAQPGSLRVGIVSTTRVPDNVLAAFGELAVVITASGGTVVVSGEVKGASFLHALLDDAKDCSTLGYGQYAKAEGLHIMYSPSMNATEMLTGMGATGVEIILAFVDDSCFEPHPFIPVIQVAQKDIPDADVVLQNTLHSGIDDEKVAWCSKMLGNVVSTASRESIPNLFGTACSNIQISRGANGISL